MPGFHRPISSGGKPAALMDRDLGHEDVEDAKRRRKEPSSTRVGHDRGNQIVQTRHTVLPAHLPLSAHFADLSSDSDSESESSVHEGFENLRFSPTHPWAVVSPDSLVLPPTPPRWNSHDAAEMQREARHRFGPEKGTSGRQAHVLRRTLAWDRHQSPPTPEMSPPTSQDSLPTVPAMQQTVKPHFLQLPLPTGLEQSHHLRQPPSSSRAESFQTAREDLSNATEPSAVASPVLANGQTVDPGHLDSVPASYSRRALSESPTSTAGPLADLEKHISYVSGPDELDHFQAQQTPTAESSASQADGTREQSSAETANNLVYRHLQEQNVKRHSGVSSTSGAITASVVVSGLDSTPKKLKRTAKRMSLRQGNPSWEETDDRSGSPKLRATKARLQDPSSPADLSIKRDTSQRQVSSPAKLEQQFLSRGAGSSPSGGGDTSVRDRKAASKRLNAAMTARKNDIRSVAAPVSARAHEPTLRHVSPSDRLSNNPSVRRTSLDASLHPETEEVQGMPSVKQSPGDDQVERSASLSVAGLDNNIAASGVKSKLLATEAARGPTYGVMPQSDAYGRLQGPLLDLPGATSPPTRKSLDTRLLGAVMTPLSISQMSDHTDVSLCQANGIRIFSHHNESLRELDLHQGSRETSTTRPPVRSLNVASTQQAHGLHAYVEPPTPIDVSATAHPKVNSPLTNPRAAPEPPLIKFIPPTPDRDLMRLHSREHDSEQVVDAALRPERRMSLLQRARRYSETFLVRTGSLRRSRRVQYEYVTEPDRPSHLSPMWRPEGFWDDLSSDDEYFDDESEAAGARLPPGGDTSDFGRDGDIAAARRGIFPRQMSRRLPGFRGSGGFLLGNSVGIDRHGTNRRRHYVSTATTTHTLTKPGSREVIRRISDQRSTAVSGAPQLRSQESLRRLLATRRGFIVPFTGGRRAHWIGAQRLRAHIQSQRLHREERAREKRRDELRDRIGTTIYHDTPN